jgi:uroporphyrinogen-III decarboxylase
MQCGERLVHCLLGEPVDRVPFGVGLGWAPWGETLARWRQESGIPHLDPAAHFGFDLSFALPRLESGLFPAFAPRVLAEDLNSCVLVDERGIVKRVSKLGESMPHFLAHPVESPRDWQRLKEERLDLRVEERVQEDWDAFRRRIARTGEAVQVGAFPYGVFGTLRDLMGTERLLLAFYDQPNLVRDMMDHLTTLWLAVWEEVGKHVQIDHIHIWEDMSGRHGTLISPRMVEEFMMPCYERIAAFAKAHGVRLISVDTDGDCSELVPLLQKHGVNVMFPFEVQAGNDILAYRDLYPQLGIMGGLDKRALARGREAIDGEVVRARQMVARGRYVPGFDHLIPADVPWENFSYAVERLREVCCG